MPCLPGHPLRSLRCRVPFALRKGRYRLNRRLRRFSQMGYDAPLPFVPGFWVPAPVSGYGAGPAGMTGEGAGMTVGWDCGRWAMMAVLN